MSRRRRAKAGQVQLDLLDFVETEKADTPVLPEPTATSTVELPAMPEPAPEASLAAAARATTKDLAPVRPATALRSSPLRIAERVADAWHSHHGAGGDIAIPVGVVAALSLFSQRDRKGRDTAQLLLALDGDELVNVLRDIWTCMWVQSPYLIGAVALPLHRWLYDERKPDRYVVTAVRAVAHAALKGGLLAITGYREPEMRTDADVLGLVLTLLRSKGAMSGLGQYFTPGEVCEAMARLVLDGIDLQPGMWIGEPAAGTGGMLRAAAVVLRDRGLNPANFGWGLGEFDPIAAACAAVNSIIWGLGQYVLIHVGDTLACGDFMSVAFKERAEALDHFERVQFAAATVAAAEQAFALLKKLGAA